MPRTKGSKNKPKTVTADFATQIAEKQSAKEALTAEIASIQKAIEEQKNTLKEKKSALKKTEKEVAIIKYLYKAKDKIVSKNELLQEVWGYSPDVSTHTIETHIYRLRQKVEHENPDAQLIMTEDGGYKLKM